MLRDASNQSRAYASHRPRHKDVHRASSLLPSRYREGTFGRVVLDAGLSFATLGADANIAHTTICRWAWSSEAGKRVTMRYPREVVGIVFLRINEASGGHYTPEHFGFRWPTWKDSACEETNAMVHAAYERIMGAVQAVRHPRDKYNAIAAAGRAAISPIDRVAWGRAWRAVCSLLFTGDREAHKTVPRGIGWYAA